MAAAGNEGGPLRGSRVLVVEDDADIRRMISTVLLAAQATAVLVGSGAQADRALEEQDYDAMLLDWNLSDMPAAELLTKAEARRPGILRRTAVMTGDLSRRRGTHEAEQRGLVLLRKPFRPRELIAALEHVLRG
jgi:two-component system phosphate regulon response regulator PhoB